MSQVDKFVRKSILAYPSLYTNRTQVLHHALCVLGNGYKWSNEGNVVSDSNFEAKPWDREQYISEFTKQSGPNTPDTVRAFLQEIAEEEADRQEAIVSTVDVRLYEREEIEDFYPQHGYALFLSMPNNVSKEWREACDEMKEMAIRAGWKF